MPQFSPYGVYSAKSLHDAGYSRRAIEALMRTGRLTRLRPGWYARDDAHPWVRQALICGGQLTGLHALKLLETNTNRVWLPPEAPVHLHTPRITTAHRQITSLPLALPATAQHGLPPVFSSGQGFSAQRMDVPVRWHQHPRIPASDLGFGVLPPHAAVLHGLFEIPFEQAVAVVDSLLRLARSRVNNRYLGRHAVLSLTHADLIRAFSGSPCGRRILRYVDTAAESGLESILRVLLTLAGHHVESQVPLPDGTRIDLLVDGILAIEINGSTHLTREQRDRDYQKDMMITAIGKVPARYSYQQILFGWPAVHADVLQKIASAS